MKLSASFVHRGGRCDTSDRRRSPARTRGRRAPSAMAERSQGRRRQSRPDACPASTCHGRARCRRHRAAPPSYGRRRARRRVPARCAAWPIRGREVLPLTWPCTVQEPASRQPQLSRQPVGWASRRVSPRVEYSRKGPVGARDLCEGDSMDDDLVRKISDPPKYLELKSKRSAFGWWLTLAMMLTCTTASSCWWPSTSRSCRSALGEGAYRWHSHRLRRDRVHRGDHRFYVLRANKQYDDHRCRAPGAGNDPF